MASIHVGMTRLEHEVTEEELQAVLWEIVRAVATKDSTRWERWSEDTNECPSQNGLSPLFNPDVAHENSCIVTKARKLAEKGIQAKL